MTGFKSLKITEVKAFKLEQENPTTHKTSYKDEEYKQIDLYRIKNTIPNTLQQAYKSVLSIKEKKDLMNLLENHHIPSCYSAFYYSL